MKAKVLATDEIIEVKEWRGASECVYSTTDMNMFYADNELEIIPDTREKVIEGWVCKDEYEDGFAHIHTEEPRQGIEEFADSGEYFGVWRSEGNEFLISDELFLDLTPESKPKKYRITITPME